jgi:hypothetical protein
MNGHSRRLLDQLFTPTTLVKQVVDSYVPEVLFNPNYTLLEPVVGDGRFLTYILHHRLLQSQDTRHIIQSLSTLHGIDIQKDNVLKARETLHKTILSMSPKVFEIENGREIIQYIINHNIIHGCAITKKYAEVDESITIRYYEILSTDPIKIEVNVYRLDNVLRTGQNNSLFGAPFPLSVCVIG